MNTPICDFVAAYRRRKPVRLHMPGHKGRCFLGCEPADITEIDGADWLYAPTGVIAQSQRNAAGLFGAGSTLYATGGSSQCIRAMLYLAVLRARQRYPGQRPVVVAGRNAHRAFLTAAALLDLDVRWLYPPPGEGSLCRCPIPPHRLADALAQEPYPAAVYITSPDYLGNTADIPALGAVAHRQGVPLLVDNAHGAYLAFLSPSRHPLALGADLCCDSAHKTLPVLTGGAYLHIAPTAPPEFSAHGGAAMALFGSTSPSYLILQSLDKANAYLAQGYPRRLAEATAHIAGLKARLSRQGWAFSGDEPLKITVDGRSRGYTGQALAAALEAQGITAEYAGPDYLVLMPTPENPPGDLSLLEQALSQLSQRPPLPPLAEAPPLPAPPRQVLSIRQAMFSPQETLPLDQAVGRVAASPQVSCPPAVAPLVPGEEIPPAAAAVCRYYGISRLAVVAPGGP